MSTEFRRKFPRRQYNRFMTILYKGRTIRAQAQEIGEGGVGLFVSENIPETHEAVLNLFVGNANFGSIRGSVAYHLTNANSGQGYTIGFKFLNLSFEMKRRIREFVSESRS